MQQPRNIVLGVLALALIVALVVLLKPGENSFTPSENSEVNDGPVVTPVTASELQSLIKSRGAKLTLVNMWASFCEPCRDEFPFFLRAFREYQDQGVDLLFVTMDFKSDLQEAKDFLIEQRVDFETFIKAEKDDAFIREVHPDWTGVIPTTFVYNSKGEQVAFVPKSMNFEELETLILAHLSKEEEAPKEKTE